MATNNVHVSDELLAELQSKAAAEGKSADEMVNAAVERFLMHGRLRDLAEYGREQAERMGLAEGDVPRLVEEHRDEQSQR